MAKSICRNTVVSLALLVKVQIVFIICNPLVFLNDLSLNIKIRKILLCLPPKRKEEEHRTGLPYSSYLTVPKCERFFSIARIFMIFTPWSLSGLMTLGLKYKLVTLNLDGTRHHLIFDEHAELTHQFLTRMLSMLWRPFFKLSIRRRNWCVCSGYASVPDPSAQCTHQFRTRMLGVSISHWCVCSLLSMFWRDCSP
jgi:hypothetical protein